MKSVSTPKNVSETISEVTKDLFSNAEKVFLENNSVEKIMEKVVEFEVGSPVVEPKHKKLNDSEVEPVQEKNMIELLHLIEEGVQVETNVVEKIEQPEEVKSNEKDKEINTEESLKTPKNSVDVTEKSAVSDELALKPKLSSSLTGNFTDLNLKPLLSKRAKTEESGEIDDTKSPEPVLKHIALTKNQKNTVKFDASVVNDLGDTIRKIDDGVTESTRKRKIVANNKLSKVSKSAPKYTSVSPNVYTRYLHREILILEELDVLENAAKLLVYNIFLLLFELFLV